MQVGHISIITVIHSISNNARINSFVHFSYYTFSCYNAAPLSVVLQLVFRFPFFPVLDSHIPSNSSSLSMAGAISFSPDSKYLCIMRSSPGVFLLYDTTIRSIVTSRHFKPRYNSYRKCGIFKVCFTLSLYHKMVIVVFPFPFRWLILVTIWDM